MSAPPPDIRDPDVLSFLDYRSYLRALYQARKKRYAFSFRAFSRRAGLRSPNYLKLVIDAERNLSGAMARRFAKACGLRGERERYFTTLVAFNQAHTLEDRGQLHARLRAIVARTTSRPGVNDTGPEECGSRDSMRSSFSIVQRAR